MWYCDNIWKEVFGIRLRRKKSYKALSVCSPKMNTRRLPPEHYQRKFCLLKAMKDELVILYGKFTLDGMSFHDSHSRNRKRSTVPMRNEIPSTIIYFDNVLWCGYNIALRTMFVSSHWVEVLRHLREYHWISTPSGISLKLSTENRNCLCRTSLFESLLWNCSQ